VKNNLQESYDMDIKSVKGELSIGNNCYSNAVEIDKYI